MTEIKVTFSSGDDEPIGSIDFGREMSLFIDIETINAFCIKCRESFHFLGDPLNYKIEYTDEDE